MRYIRPVIALALLILASRPAGAQIDSITNLPVVIVSTTYDAAATSIVLTTGHGARLPAADFNCAWYNATDYPGGLDASAVLDPNYEVVRVTARSTDTLTVTRAQESTSASTKNTGAKTYVMACGNTAKSWTDIKTALGATFLTTSTNSVLTNEAVLAGTADQVILTGSTLSLPQSIATTSTPTFGGWTATSDTQANLNANTYSATAGTASLFKMRRGRGTAAAILRVLSGDTLGQFDVDGYYAADDVSAGTAARATRITTTALENWVSTGRGAQLNFQTVDTGGTALGTRMLLNNTVMQLQNPTKLTVSSGTLNLGVGTTTYASLTSSAFTLASGVGLQMTGTSGITGGTNLFMAPESGRGWALLQAENNPIEPGGGSDEHETDLYIFGKHDSVTNYFTGGVTLGPGDGSYNSASGYSVLNEGNWTNAGGFTLSRLSLYDHIADTEVLMHQSSSPGVVLFGRTTNGARSMGIRATGKEINTDADGTTSSGQFNGNFIKNDSNTRGFDVVKILPSFNFGGSNTTTTVNVLKINTTNTTTTGATVNLINAQYGDSDRAALTSAGTLKLGGTANRGTTEGTFSYRCFNGTAPAGTLTNGAEIYCASGEMRVMDSAGNSTLLSPHDDETGEAIFFSQNTVTGRVFRADIEAMYRKLDAMLGGGYVTEFVGDPSTVYGGGGQGRVSFTRLEWAPYAATPSVR